MTALRRVAATAAILATLTLAGCGTTGQADPADQADPITTVDPITTQDDFAEPTETTEPEPAEVAIGGTFTWTDGLAAAVVKVRRAKISEVASGGNPARHDNLVVTVKMTATTKASTELSVLATLHYGRDGREAEAVFDADGYGGTATDAMQEHPDRLAKGRSLTGTFGFAVPKGAKTPVVFTFQPGFDYIDATFTGRA